VPTLDRLAPLGDHARDSAARLYDYHRHLMLEAVLLHPGARQAEHGAWWLTHYSVPQMKGGFNYRHELLDRERSQRHPTDPVYHARGAGHLFA